ADPHVLDAPVPGPRTVHRPAHQGLGEGRLRATPPASALPDRELHGRSGHLRAVAGGGAGTAFGVARVPDRARAYRLVAGSPAGGRGGHGAGELAAGAFARPPAL